MVEGFIVSLDSVFIYLVTRCCVLRVDPAVGLQAGELRVRWDGGVYLERLVSGHGHSAIEYRPVGWSATQPQESAAAALVVQSGRGRDRLLRLLGMSPLRPRPVAVETAAAVGCRCK